MINKKISLIMAVLVTAIIFSACEEETPEPVVINAKAARVTGIIITTLSLADWDPDNSGPDVSFKISNESQILYDYQTYIENVKSDSLPLGFSIDSTYLLPKLDQKYIITLYDYDPLDSNDDMDYISFNPGDYKSEKPDSKVISTANAQIEIFFKWE